MPVAWGWPSVVSLESNEATFQKSGTSLEQCYLLCSKLTPLSPHVTTTNQRETTTKQFVILGCGQSAICETTKVMPTLFHNCIRNVTFRKAHMFHTFKGPIQGRTPCPAFEIMTSWLPVIGGEESIWNHKIHQNPRRGWCRRMLVVWPVFFVALSRYDFCCSQWGPGSLQKPLAANGHGGSAKASGEISNILYDPWLTHLSESCKCFVSHSAVWGIR